MTDTPETDKPTPTSESTTDQSTDSDEPPTVSTLSKTCAVADLDAYCQNLDGDSDGDDVTAEPVSFLNRGVLEHALEIADALQLHRVEFAVLDGSADATDDDVDNPLVALREPDADAAILVAPRSDSLDDYQTDDDSGGGGA